MREERRRSASSQPRTTGNVSLPNPSDVSGCIPCKIEAISPCVDRLMREITKSKCVAGEEEDVELALLEAVGNAVIHGNLENPEKEVYIRCRSRKRSGLLIAVKDEGNGFDPKEWENSPAGGRRFRAWPGNSPDARVHGQSPLLAQRVGSVSEQTGTVSEGKPRKNLISASCESPRGSGPQLR